MTIGLVLTIVLAILTATSTFDLSLLQILLPALIELGISLLILIAFLFTGRKIWKKSSRSFDTPYRSLR